MKTTILAQMFGLLGALSLLLSSWQTSKKKALVYISLDSLFYIIQYALLGAYSGLFSNIVSFIRTLTFYFKDQNKFIQNKITIFLIAIAYLLVGILTYDGITSIFPVVVSILYTLSLWQDDVKIIRYSTALLVLGWFIYNISVGAYSSSIVEFILLVSSLISIIKLDIIKDARRKK